MANIVNIKNNISGVNASYKKLLALGEGAKSDDFRMTFEGAEYKDLEFLVQATQLPELKREPIESYGPHGVKFNQAGKFLNAGDITITFKEVISGKVYGVLRKIVKEKIYLKITLALLGESQPTSVAAHTLTLEDCWIEIDALDLSVEDGATLVKPSGTIHYNWASWLDGASETLDWGAAAGGA